jgi:glutathione S-transferase
LIEEWADESIGLKGRKAFIGALNQYQNFRASLLPANIPDFLKNVVSSFPSELLNVLSSGVGLGESAFKEAERGIKQDLEALCLILEQRPYLVTNQPTLADLTVAALSIILKYPQGSYLDIPENLKGKGIPGIGDSSTYSVFFDWRDRLYADYRKPLGVSSPSGSSPTSIEIE